MQRVPKSIAGVRAKSGRRAPANPGHYLTDHRESRQIDKALDAALERIRKRQGITPDHPPAACPMRKPRRAGLQNLCFRNLEKGPQTQE